MSTILNVSDQLSPYGRGRKLASQFEGRAAGDTAIAGRALTSAWRPFELQEAVLATDTGIYILIAGLGGGKTLLAALKLVRWILANPRREDGTPTAALVLGKDFRLVKGTQFKWILYQLRSIVAEICDRCRELGIKSTGPLEKACIECVPLSESLIVKSVRYGEDPTIELWNGCEIKAYSGTNAEATRGPGFDFIWIDEGEYLNIDAFETGMGRLRSASDIRVIITSSPDGAGWLYPLINGEYEEWKDLRTSADVRVFRWRSKDNPVNQGKVLKTLRAIYNARGGNRAAQELDGRFLGTSEAPGTGVLEYEKAFVGKLTLAAGEERAVGIGADLARAEDFCWFTAVNARGVALEMDQFNFGTVDVARLDFWPYARRRLMAMAYRTGALWVCVDTARGGEQFAAAIREDLERADPNKPEDHIACELKARGFTVIEVASDSGGRRSGLIEGVGSACKLGRFIVPTAWQSPGGEWVVVREYETLRLQFKKIQAEIQPGGKRKFITVSGVHDDGIVSGGLCMHGLGLMPSAPAVLSDLSHLLGRSAARSASSPYRPGPGGPGRSPLGGRGGGYSF